MPQYVEPEEPIRLSPEQTECLHPDLEWLRFSCVFRCKECSTPLIMPELAEALNLSLCND